MIELVDLKVSKTYKDLLTDLRAAAAPIILWGAGVGAGSIYDELTTQGISIRHIAVDRGYLPPPHNHFRGHEVCSIEDVCALERKGIILIGFYNNSMEELEERYKRLLGPDHEKFSFVALDHGVWADPANRLMSVDWIERHHRELNETMELLADDHSRQVLRAFLRQRISVQCGELNKYVQWPQYFLNELVSLGPAETYIDCGAYDGDSLKLFFDELKAREIDSYDSIYAFEPDPVNFERLVSAYASYSDMHLFNTCTWSHDDILSFESGKDMLSEVSVAGTNKVPATSIDNVLSGRQATFIKMDVQGAELPSIHGARNTIKTHQPTLAICIYHRREDLITLPKCIHEIFPAYKLFIRAHSVHAKELVLYAIP